MNRASSGNRGSGTTLNADSIREDLIKRVETSRTFEKSQRLRAFFSYISQCALKGQPESATEQQIGIHVFNRTPGYNPSEDNVVRSQARLLRWKLEQYFGDEGRNEPLVITVPKGQYLPVFEERSAATASYASVSPKAHRPYLLAVLVGLVVLGLAAVWFVLPLVRSRLSKHPTADVGASSASSSVVANNVSVGQENRVGSQSAAADDGGIRIEAGYTGPSFADNWGQRWSADKFYDGGIAVPGPHDLFPPVGDARLFRTLRESLTPAGVGSPEKSVFAYNIPAPAGVYELRLYFADPDWQSNAKGREDSQNTRHFSVVLNQQSLLWGFDPVADGTTGAVDIRAFKDVIPEKDGMVHLQFIPDPERPFVNAIELTPGTMGKIKPIRIAAQSADVVDRDGTRWSADKYFIRGRTIFFAPGFSGAAGAGELIPTFALGERFGNFSYAIPVPPGSYTVKLYFVESFFIPSIAAGMCSTGTGCRVFDVACNGVMLLHDFDIYKAAGGGNKVVTRVFHGLHPNGQGKLLLTFSPTVNYAEVRAMEVLDDSN